MASATLTIHSLTLDELKRALLAHKTEFEVATQPTHIATSYISEHDHAIGAFVRVEGPECFTLTTLPLTPASASIIAAAVNPS